MDEELYDEFGNYVGPGLSSSSSSDEVAVENGEDGEVEMGEVAVEVEDEADGIVEDVVEEEAAAGEEDAGNAIVLAEDKKYYPTAEEVFGEGTEAMVEEEDAQAITEPIIAPTKKKEIDVLDREMKDGMKTLYDVEYLAGEARQESSKYSFLQHAREFARTSALIGSIPFACFFFLRRRSLEHTRTHSKRRGRGAPTSRQNHVDGSPFREDTRDKLVARCGGTLYGYTAG